MAGKGKPQLDFEVQLATIPIRNERVRSLPGRVPHARTIELDVRHSRVRGVLARLLKLKTTKKYELAGLSLDLYDSLDGQKSVEDLVDALMARYKLSFFEARALLLQFLRDLMRRGLVVVAVPKAEIDTTTKA